MAFATKCDRCGTYKDGRSFTITFSGRYGLDWVDKEYDLCAECAHKFIEFMNGAKVATLREKLIGRLKRKD